MALSRSLLEDTLVAAVNVSISYRRLSLVA